MAESEENFSRDLRIKRLDRDIADVTQCHLHVTLYCVTTLR